MDIIIYQFVTLPFKSMHFNIARPIGMDGRQWGGGGGGGGGGVKGVTFYIWHSTDVRAEWPPFSALPGI